MTLARRTIAFVNLGHALDHFVLLVFPTVAIAIAAEGRLAYGNLIALTTGAFFAFGLFSLPAGWVADRLGRRNLLAIFFLGVAVCCLLLSLATAPWHFATLLLALGIFAAIYHPVGTAMLVSHSQRLGRDLGRNGVFGNMGAAAASGVSAAVAGAFGWRAAFLVPALACAAVGLAFLWLVRSDGEVARASGAARPPAIPVSRPALVIAVFALALVAGGLTFNILTISLPKVIDERIGLDLPLGLVGSLATGVFVVGALAQLTMGRLIDRFSVPTLFAALAILQPAGMLLAAYVTGIPMLVGLVFAMASVYGQVVINDGMVARYVPAHFQSKAFGLRYFVGSTVSGLAVPLIAVAHAHDGLRLVLLVAALCGTVVFAAALGFMFLARPAAVPSPVAAE